MGVISNPPPIWVNSATGKCSLCGKASVAFWVADEGTIEVCRHCAETILPALFADAIWRPEDRQCLEQVINQAKTTFWRALASRLAASVRAKARGASSCGH